MTVEQSLIDCLPHPAAIIDDNGRIERTNRPFRETFAADSETAELSDFLLRSLDLPCGWKPVGNWRDDRILLERGIGCDAGKLHVVALDRTRSLFVTVKEGEDQYIRAVRYLKVYRSTVTTLLRSIDHAAFVLDGTGTVLDHNFPALSLVPPGVTPVTGRRLDDVLPMRQGDASVKPSVFTGRAAARNRDSSFSAELAVVLPGDLSLDVELNVFPIRHVLPAGAPVDPISDYERDTTDEYTVVVVKNLEERQKIHKDLKYLQRADNITRAATGVAQEITNGCTALFGQIDLVGRRTGEDLSVLYAAVRKLQRLGYRLAGFSGDPLGSVAADESGGGPLPVTETVEETIINTVELALGGSSIRATFSISPPPEPVAVAADRISQVLFNVMTNAVDAMNEGGVVHVDASTPHGGGFFRITVRDEGHGMDPRTLDEVIKPYFTTKDQGIGMGLTVTNSILAQCGGRMEINTDPGFGTTVDLFLPLLSSTAEDRLGPEAPEREPVMAGLPVLLVEDDHLVRRSMERSLHALGCDVTTVENGERALPLIINRIDQGNPFGLLITDLTMPGRMDGVDLLRRVRELDPEIPAILSTGTLHLHRGRPHREAGFQAILHKPFGLDQLRDSILTAFRAAG